jgi:hypothetical protein
MHENYFVKCNNVDVTCRGEIERKAIIILQVLLYRKQELLSFLVLGYGLDGRDKRLFFTPHRPEQLWGIFPQR